MKSTAFSFSLSLFPLCGVMALTGCAFSISDVTTASSPAATVTMSGGIQGTNYGGHAPIAGAHVYVLQAGQSGYGSAATSLIPSTASGAIADTTIVGTSANPAYYVTTDTAGDINISGDYTCTAGLPVYLYALGGSPDVNPSVGYSYITSATGNGSSVTFTVNEEKFYVGQQVLIANIPAATGFSALNGTQTVTAISTSGNTTFSVASTITGTSSAFNANSNASPLGSVNPAITNVAVLGNCPSAAPYNFGSGSSDSISMVYMNEVSTVAAMFALAPFGTDALHIGIPASDSLALTGIENAANNAGQLYDITGATNQQSGTDGEGHIARSAVPNSGTGQGVATVPQALIDTLGNILAACVDSANTYGLGATTGTTSPACQVLFETATSNGVPVSSLGATTPEDTATAAINIAHYPAGNGASAGSFMTKLFGIPTGVVPFAPNLGSTQPTDFVIGINITVPQGSNPTNYLGSSGTTPTAAIPTAIATDASGDALVGTTGCGSGGVESATNGYGCVLQLLPTQLLPGLPTVSGVAYAQGVRSVAIGPTNRVWVTGTLETGQTVSGFTPIPGAFYVVQSTVSPTTPLVTGASSTALSFVAYGNTDVNGVPGTYTNYYGNPTAIALNGNAHAYIADSTKNYLHDITGINLTPSYTSINLDSEYLIQGAVSGGNLNCEADVTALAIGPLTPATTANGSGAYNVWTASAAGSTTQGMCTMPDPVPTSLTASIGNTPTVNSVTPVSQIGPQYTPTSIAVDANDVAWDTNSATGNETGEGFPDNGVSNYAGDFTFANSLTTKPSGVAIDGNNNIWITNFGSNSVSVYTNEGPPTTTGGSKPVVISPSGTAVDAGNGGYLAGGTLSGPSAIAIDISGDVWVTNTTSSGVGYSVTELIGVAAPTYSPLSAARAANKLGAKP